MVWILFALIPPALWAMMNHFDKYLINRYCQNKSVGSLIIYSGLIGLPIAFVIGIPNPNIFRLVVNEILITILSGAIYLCAMIAYLKALETDEASIVAPLFQMSSIISLILGFIVFGEVLSQNQLIGAFTVLSGSIGLSVGMDENKKLIFKGKTFLLMLLASFFFATNGILFKFVAIDSDFWISAFWMYIGYIVYTAILFVISKQVRGEFLEDFKGNSIPIFSLNIINEVFTAIGNLSFNFATLLAPIGLVYFISEGIQPFFVLLYGIILTKFFPRFGQENMLADHLIQKVLAIILMAVGVYLVSN